MTLPRRSADGNRPRAAVEGNGGVNGGGCRFGNGSPAEDHSDRTRDGFGCRCNLGCGDACRVDCGAGRGRDKGLGEQTDFAGATVERVGGDPAEPASARCEFDQGCAVVDDGVAQSQEECAEIFLRVGADEDDRAARLAGIGDGGARQSQNRFSW